MATLPVANVLIAVKAHLVTLSGEGQALSVVRYVSLATSAQEAIYQILSAESSYPSIVITPGDFRVTKRFTGGSYDYAGYFQVWIVTDSIIDQAGEESLLDLMTWEGDIRDSLDNETLNVTGLQRILFDSIGSPVVVTIDGQTPEFVMTPVKFTFIGREIKP